MSLTLSLGRWFRLCDRFTALRIALGMLLVAAAALKGHELATVPFPHHRLFSARWMLIVLVDAELVFGLWLFWGFRPVFTRWVGLWWFGLLCVASGLAVLSGSKNCGCFGRLSIDPMYSLLLDTFAFAALWSCRPCRPVSRRATTFRLASFASTVMVMGSIVTLLLVVTSPDILSATGIIDAPNGIVAIDPEAWSDQRFPLLPYIEIDARLDVGDWIVLLFHHECERCRERLQHYRQNTWRLLESKSQARVAIVEVPPFEAGGTYNFSNDGLVNGRLTNRFEWFAELPIEIRLEDGIVQGAVKG